MKATRKTLIVSVLGALGLLAVWYFVLRKAPANTLDQALTTEATTEATTTTTTTPNDTLSTAVNSLGSLVSTLTNTVQKTAAATADWVKTKGATSNTWTNAASGQTQELAKGKNPNRLNTLTGDDLLKLQTPENESLA